MEPVAIQVPVVQTTQAVQMHHKIVEYERPRMIPGRMVRAYAGPTQTVGMAQPQMYGSMAQPQMYGSSSFAPMMGGYGAMPGMMNGYPTIVSSQAANTGVYSAPQDNTDAISA